MSNHITKQIVEDMLTLSVEVIKYAQNPNINRSIQDQITRAATSIGANYTEAQDASSKRDFVNKIYIAKKEASETLYWLKLLQRLLGSSDKNDQLQDTAQKFVMMLQKIINSSRSPSSQAKG